MKLLSEIPEGTRISAEAIRANLMCSVLTTLGIVIGIVTVTLMATAREALNGAWSGRERTGGAHAVETVRGNRLGHVAHGGRVAVGRDFGEGALVP